MHDYDTGLDPKRASASRPTSRSTASKPGENLASRFKREVRRRPRAAARKRRSDRLERGTLTVAVKDRQGNRAKIEARFPWLRGISLVPIPQSDGNWHRRRERCPATITPRRKSFAATKSGSSPRRWLCAGRESDLPAPGDFIAPRNRRREPDRPPRPRRRRAGLLQRLPPPRHAALRGIGRAVREHDPVSVPRLDLRPRRLAARRSVDGRRAMVSTRSDLRVCSRRSRSLGRIHFPVARRAAAARSSRRSRR